MAYRPVHKQPALGVLAWSELGADRSAQRQTSLHLKLAAHLKFWSNLVGSPGLEAEAVSNTTKATLLIIDFPTREDAILDLIYSGLECKTQRLPHLGTRDHLTLVARWLCSATTAT